MPENNIIFENNYLSFAKNKNSRKDFEI